MHVCHHLWRFFTAWYGTVWFTFVCFFHWAQCLVLFFLVPPRPRFQVSHTVTKTWRVKSADYWLARANHHWTCGTKHNRPADLNQHCQWRIKWNCQKMAVSLSFEEVQVFLSLIDEERIQRERDGAEQNLNVFQELRLYRRHNSNNKWIIPPTLKRY